MEIKEQFIIKYSNILYVRGSLIFELSEFIEEYDALTSKFLKIMQIAIYHDSLMPNIVEAIGKDFTEFVKDLVDKHCKKHYLNVVS
mgnify:FL=1